jgi:hypothetical protein
LIKFSEFWVLYLRAHRMPGTRALHYFATAVGIMSVVEAVLERQPVFLLGIGLSYGIAIGSHWFIERNRPLIRVNALWGAMADIRLCWAAITGRVEREMAAVVMARVEAGRVRAIGSGTSWIAPSVRWVLPLASVVGLTGALLDLDDLGEAGTRLYYSLAQLGGPVLCFAGACIAAICATALVSSFNFRGLGRPRPETSFGDLPASAIEGSLWCACGALLVLGALMTIVTELVEDGLSPSLQLCAAFGIVIAMIALAPALLLARPRLAR